MRTRQNSGCSTVPKSGIGRGISLPRGHKRLIENARLRSNLSSNDSSQLQISNRERMAISPRAADASSIGILSDQRESKGLIANLELEFHLKGRKTNHMQFSNRKFSTVFASKSSVSTVIACSSTQLVLIYGGAIKTARNTFKIYSIRISNRR